MKNILISVALCILATIQTECSATPSIQSLSLLSSTRFSRTIYDYTYKVTFAGDESNYQSVRATLTATGQGTSIVQGVVNAGPLASHGTTESTDTFTIRQDRTIPFNASALKWQITGFQQGLLPGAASQDAASSGIDINRTYRALAGAFYIEPSGSYVLRTAATVRFNSGVAIGQINDFLLRTGARVYQALPGALVFFVSMPDSGTLEGQESILDQWRSDPIVAHAELSRSSIDTALPVGIQHKSDLYTVAHQLAIGASGVWNVRAALRNVSHSNSLQFIIMDTFGMGAIQVDDTSFAVGPSSQFATGKCLLSELNCWLASGHGYHVLGIAGASWNSPAIAGIFAADPYSFRPRLTVVDKLLTVPKCTTTGLEGATNGAPIPCVSPDVSATPNGAASGANTLSPETEIPVLTPEFVLAREIVKKSQTGRVLVNLSQGMGLDADPSQAQKNAVQWAHSWLNMLQGTKHSNVVFVTSAGNEANVPAKLNSPWNAAALMDGFGLTHDNTLVVEARDSLLNDKDRFRAAGRTEDTSQDGDVSAIGCLREGGSEKGITSFIKPGKAGNNHLKLADGWLPVMRPNCGTSQAAPQVSGLAALLWDLQPTLSSQQIKARILANAKQDDPCCAPLIDPYATLLGVDSMPSSHSQAKGKAPVRSALFDVNDDGVFDISDVQLASAAIAAGNGKDLWGEDFDTEGTRFDFNNDGYLGGLQVSPFNLDMSVNSNGVATFTSDVARPNAFPSDRWLSVLGSFSAGPEVPNTTPPPTFSEIAASDQDVLCHAISTPLFSGDQADAFRVASEAGIDCDIDLKLNLGFITPTNYTKSPPAFVDSFEWQMAFAYVSVEGRTIISPRKETIVVDGSKQPSCVPPADFVSFAASTGTILSLRIVDLPEGLKQANPGTTNLFPHINWTGNGSGGCDGFIAIVPGANINRPAVKMRIEGVLTPPGFVANFQSLLGVGEHFIYEVESPTLNGTYKTTVKRDWGATFVNAYGFSEHAEYTDEYGGSLPNMWLDSVCQQARPMCNQQGYLLGKDISRMKASLYQQVP